MPLKSPPQRYGKVAIAIHWITALALLAMLFSGFRAANLGDSTAKLGLLRIHATVGIAVLGLTIARILWWFAIDKMPANVADEARWRQIATTCVHLLLYLAILLMAGSGIAMIAISGTGDIIWGTASGELPDFTQFQPRALHGIGAFALIVLSFLHIAAALYHQFVLHDHLLARMGFGRI